MLKEKEAMKGEMYRRIVYGSERFVKEMTTEYKIPENLRRIGDKSAGGNEIEPFL